MSTLMRKAMHMLEAATPASGFKPETSEEWDRLLKAYEELGYAIYCEGGMPPQEARHLARQTHGGLVGRTLLEIGFMEHKDAESKM